MTDKPSARTTEDGAPCACLTAKPGVARPPTCRVGDLVQRFSSERALSPAEQHVLVLAAHGLTTKEIATVRQQSAKTVDQYWYRIYCKTGLGSQRDLLARLLDLAMNGRVVA
jgi:DNA-binding CsgD family transcriptional regulator